ncbi:phosphoenolpyruvate--protein phosphotransferase [bacterium]|nr:phosphoenolpyruvate--protein phosphotransferase [bacterium]
MTSAFPLKLNGVVGVKGISLARSYVYRRRLEVVKKSIDPEAFDMELERLNAAIELTKLDIQNTQKEALAKHGSKYAAIFDAHLLMLSDSQFGSKIVTRLKKELVNVESIVYETINLLVSQFMQIEDEYIRERAIDMQDVGDRLLRHLLGLEGPAKEIGNEPFVLLSDEITPSELLDFSKGPIKGVCLDSGGATSHVAILAGALEIPAVFGLVNLSRVARTGDVILVDSRNKGIVILSPDEKMISEAVETIKVSKDSSVSTISAAEVVTTLDGIVPCLGVNIARIEELPLIQKKGIQRIGLFRSEFLFMESIDLPSEEFQEGIYSQVVQAAPESAVLRTIDIGSDKPVKYLTFPKEANPSMGFRSIRFSLSRPDVLLPQLRAMIRASQKGNSKIIFPMVSMAHELETIKSIWELALDQVSPSKAPEWGIMLEVPSGVFMMDVISKFTRYISLGTNDLFQFTFGADRSNERLSEFFDPLTFPFLRMLKMGVENAHAEGITVGICGEMAADPASFSILLGLGVDEFSMRPSSLGIIRNLIPQINVGELRPAIKEILKNGERNIRKCLESLFPQIVYQNQ